MLKETGKTATNSTLSQKRGSIKSASLQPLANGLNRRAFLKTGTAISVLAGLAGCKPSVPNLAGNSGESDKVLSPAPKSQRYFSPEQHKALDAVQMQLFPDDSNGPSAREINAMAYLERAMKDPQNIADGDPEFIAQGIGWLDDLARQTLGDNFVKLSPVQQEKVLTQIASSTAGENWMSILMYYLTEALMLDPVYGGNPEMVGWKWLEHQAGFPRPIEGKTYRDFD